MALRWIEDYATVVNQLTKRGLLQALAVSITSNGTSTDWVLSYPADLSSIENVFTITHLTGDKTVSIEFSRPAKFKVLKDDVEVEKDNYHFMEIRFGTGYTAPIATDLYGVGTWEVDLGSVRTRFSWFKSNTKANIKGWLPVKYWISSTSDSLAIVLEGSPSANPYDRLISFAYIGELESFAEDVATSASSNFGVCCSSDVSAFDYLTEEEINQFSDNTGTGVTDLTMIETSDGFPMQAHNISLTTPDEFTNRAIEGPSAYTQKYHMTYIYVFHNFDGYRGRLKNAIAYDRNTLVNQDNLRHMYIRESDVTRPTVTDRYKVFLVNAPFSIFNNADNVMFGVALLQETDYDVSLYLEPGSFELEELGTGTFNAIFENASTGTKYNATNESEWTINKHDTNITITKGLLSNTDTPGNYEVTATYNGYTATGIVKIREPYPVSLAVTPASASIWQGGTVTYKVEVTMSNGAKHDVTGVSTVVLPDEDNTGTSINAGVISNAQVPGNYVINATYKELTASATLEVKEIICSSISVSPSTITVDQGDAASYTAVANMSDGTTRDLTAELGEWSITGTGTDISISHGVIADDQTVGAYEVKVTYRDKIGTASLIVNEKFVPYLTVSPSTYTVPINRDKDFDAKYFPTKGSTGISVTTGVEWSISPSTTTIDSSGKVAGTETPDSYTVTATYAGASDSAVLTVHGYDYGVKIEWPVLATSDYDMHSRVYDSNDNLLDDNTRGDYDNTNGHIYLDDDTTDGGSETMTVDGTPGAYIIFAIENYNGDGRGDVVCTAFNYPHVEVATKTISEATAAGDGKITDMFKLDLGTGTFTVL